MTPRQIYDKIEDAWKFAAVKKMALELIASGVQAPNPEAWTFDEQEKSWARILGDLRLALDELEKLGKQSEGEGRNG